MTTNPPGPTYDRAPSAQLASLLEPGQPLRELLQGLRVHGERLDLHFRRGDEIKLYAGGTCPLVMRHAKGKIRVTGSEEAYQHARNEASFPATPTSADDPELHRAIKAFIEHATVLDTCSKHQGNEGAVQTKWASIQDGEPWIPLDREAVIGYGSVTERNAALAKAPLDLAWTTLPEGDGYPRRPTQTGRSRELDQLGIDNEGRLVLIELKDAKASSAAPVSAAPMQLLQYVHEWHHAVQVPGFRAQLQALIAVKKRLGLLPGLKNMPDFTTSIQLRPVIAFDEYLSKARSAKFENLVQHVNGTAPDSASSPALLPPNTLPVEVWSFEDASRPLRHPG